MCDFFDLRWRMEHLVGPFLCIKLICENLLSGHIATMEVMRLLMQVGQIRVVSLLGLVEEMVA